jgi:hypothetical protein
LIALFGVWATDKVDKGVLVDLFVIVEAVEVKVNTSAGLLQEGDTRKDVGVLHVPLVSKLTPVESWEYLGAWR